MAKIVTLDFETYYDAKSFSLKNMTTAEYVCSPLFQIIGVGVSVNGGEPKWHSDSELSTKQFLEQYKLDEKGTLTVAHNAMFDGAVLEWVLGIKPWRYFCTMMGSRPIYAQYCGSMSLKALSLHLGIGEKGTEVSAVSGKRREDFNGTELLRYASYCLQDVSLTYKLFKNIYPQFPSDEAVLVDLTVKKFTRPRLVLDKRVIEEALAAERAEKEELLEKAGLNNPDVLMSNPRFADELRKFMVDPPMKLSLTTGQPTYAFAKSDPGFKKLLDHKNPGVVNLCKARLAWKSTITETRLDRFLNVANATPNKVLPVPLLYYGAHPGRFSGFDKLNLQNLGRKSPLRRAITAPPGHKVVAGDLSQIEARITACLAGEDQLVEAFRYYDGLVDSDRDVYCQFGDSVYGREITKADEVERFVAKTGVLSLGYQSGAQKFHDSMKGFGLEDFTFAMAQDVVYTYRELYKRIVDQWQIMETLIKAMASGNVLTYGPIITGKNSIRLPNGMHLQYPDLTNMAGRHMYRSGREKRDLYGGKLTENVVQALARIVMTTAELRLAKAGLRAALSVHDELVFVVPEEKVPQVKRALRMALTAKVPWMPDLPVNCEIGVGDNYGEAK
jgi:DNA polymerase